MEEGGEGDTPAPTSQNNQEVLPGAYVSADLTASVNARPTPKPCFKRIHSLEIPDLEYENRGSTEDQEEFINVINSELSETINIDVCGRNEGFRYDCFTPAESSHPGELDELFAGPSLLDDTLLTYPATSSTPLTNRVSGPVPSLRQSKGRVSRKQQIQGLRETVTELTRQRDDLQLMASTSSLEVSDPSSPASCSASQRVASLLAKPQSIWEHIAAQQLVIRQNSEEENARLRDLIDQQKQQARNFRRMIRRRRDEELLDDHLSKRPKIRHNEEIFDELLQGLDDLYVDLDKLFTEKNMAGVPCPGREHQVYPNAAEGAEFVEFLDKNRVPFDFHRAENAVWAFLQSSRVCERQNGQHKICATELKQSSCTSKSSAAFTYFEKDADADWPIPTDSVEQLGLVGALEPTSPTPVDAPIVMADPSLHQARVTSGRSSNLSFKCPTKRKNRKEQINELRALVAALTQQIQLLNSSPVNSSIASAENCHPWERIATRQHKLRLKAEEQNAALLRMKKIQQREIKNFKRMFRRRIDEELVGNRL
ncbi:hypothetical protein PR003_g3543 [Phytophthora rubi]|uniref:Uncharacterized protein n=1 Tax=Phytophthora rubi TaxID=129364 RepID=A0A6A4FXF0_9STRA|nr:hypothetical protein PR003_g3543 [Phytophthora rubi]